MTDTKSKVRRSVSNNKKASVPSIKNRINQLLEQLGEGLHEREKILAIALLAAISGQNAFLYGPPGTAKSLISRRLACAFKDANYFEYLMNRFSTPEEVFGPVSIKELKEDRYTRQIEGYLPTANFAFLDEIWKSSPAILNTLLTLINEHVFKNGSDIVEVPLKALIAASNEVPAENQGLDALFDRFIVRLQVPPIKEQKHFNALLNAKPSSSNPVVEPELTITQHELVEWRQQLYNVQLSDDTLLIIKHIRSALAEKFEELSVYVSDRRWQRAAMLVKASAFCNGRDRTNHTDVVLLKHCLWTSPENQQSVEEIVMRAIEECGFTSDTNLASLDNEKGSLDNEINKELFYSKDVYDTVRLGDKEYFKTKVTFDNRKYHYHSKTIEIWIPTSEFKSNMEFSPVDHNGNELTQITGEFDSQGSCNLSYDHYEYKDSSFTPNVLFHKGDKKEEVNIRLIKSLASSVSSLREELSGVLKATERKLTDYKLQLESPFVSEQETDIAVSGVIEQINQLQLRIKDCERLEALCN
ncbi:AAA family ATPase [Pseudoalteromonas phenolica]|uniref:AAA family ATPase n=1 Tax=Pseudoalteromonas phenolica TaxID=161398 RepID=UPI00110C0EB9|nr:AAA family ATPase [Pseudoalteromonas phenolica]TMO57103.1 ATPase [Pseudoalteromonas phenolica]